MGKANTECYNSGMRTALPSPVILHADQEHDGLRAAVVLLLMVLFLFSFWLVNALLRWELFSAIRDYAVSVSCVGGLMLALGASAVVEMWLKRVWHSGRSLTLNEQGILIQTRRQADQQIHRGGSLTYLNWTFKLSGYRRGGREKRLPAKWVCLACQLQQDDCRLIVYSYMPPKKAARWLEDGDSPHKFHAIDLSEASDSSLAGRVKMPARPEISNEMLRGRDGRYWLAERTRWTEGFELTPKDFATFMQYLQTQ